MWWIDEMKPNWEKRIREDEGGDELTNIEGCFKWIFSKLKKKLSFPLLKTKHERIIKKVNLI